MYLLFVQVYVFVDHLISTCTHTHTRIQHSCMHTHAHAHTHTHTHAHTHTTHTHTHTHAHTHTQNELIEPFLGGLRIHPFPSLGSESIRINTGQVSDSIGWALVGKLHLAYGEHVYLAV